MLKGYSFVCAVDVHCTDRNKNKINNNNNNNSSSSIDRGGVYTYGRLSEMDHSRKAARGTKSL